MNSDNTGWYYADPNSNPIGPFSLPDLQRLAQAAMINGDTLVVEEGGTIWRPYSSVTETPSSAPVEVPQTSPSAMPPSSGGVLRWRLVVAGALAVTFLIICAIAGIILFWPKSNASIAAAPQVTEPVSSAADPTPAETSNSSGPKGVDPNQPEIFLGEPFRFGDDTYEILRSTRRRSIDDQFSQTPASRGGVFLIIDYTVTNESNGTQTIASDSFVLVDAQGRAYRPSSEALTALLTASPNKDFLLTELQPGLTKKTQTAYEVPIEVALGDTYLAVPRIGGEDVKMVTLNVRPTPTPASSPQ